MSMCANSSVHINMSRRANPSSTYSSTFDPNSRMSCAEAVPGRARQPSASPTSAVLLLFPFMSLLLVDGEPELVDLLLLRLGRRRRLRHHRADDRHDRPVPRQRLELRVVGHLLGAFVLAGHVELDAAVDLQRLL